MFTRTLAVLVMVAILLNVIVPQPAAAGPFDEPPKITPVFPEGDDVPQVQFRIEWTEDDPNLTQVLLTEMNFQFIDYLIDETGTLLTVVGENGVNTYDVSVPGVIETVHLGLRVVNHGSDAGEAKRTCYFVVDAEDLLVGRNIFYHPSGDSSSYHVEVEIYEISVEGAEAFQIADSEYEYQMWNCPESHGKIEE